MTYPEEGKRLNEFDSKAKDIGVEEREREGLKTNQSKWTWRINFQF